MGFSELDKSYFSYGDLFDLFQKMEELYRANKPLNIYSANIDDDLYAEMASVGFADNPQQFKVLIAYLKNNKMQRDILSLLDRAKIDVMNGRDVTVQVETLMGELVKIIQKDSVIGSIFTNMRDASKTAKTRYEKAEMGEMDDFIPSGYDFLDKQYCGLIQKSVVVIGALSQGGKSSMWLPIVWANRNIDIFIGSTEVDAPSIVTNLAANQLGISRFNCYRGKLVTGEREKYLNFLEKEMEHFKKTSGVSSERVLKKFIMNVKIWRKSTNMSKPALLVVDYLQDYFDERGDVFRYEHNTPNAFSMLKRLCLEENMCVIVLSQFKKGGRNEKGWEPDMTSFIGSAAAEQVSDIGILIHRPDLILPEAERSRFEGDRYYEVTIKIAKYKNAAQKSFPAIFDALSCRFFIPEMCPYTFNGEKKWRAKTALEYNEQWNTSFPPIQEEVSEGIANTPSVRQQIAENVKFLDDNDIDGDSQYRKPTNQIIPTKPIADYFGSQISFGNLNEEGEDVVVPF